MLFDAFPDGILSVQVVGRSGETRPNRDLDVLVITTRKDPKLTQAIHQIEAEVETEARVGLAVKVTSPEEIEILGERGTPVWDLVRSGLPVLAAPTERKALPPARPAPAPARRGPALNQADARRKVREVLLSTQLLLDHHRGGEAASLLFLALRCFAKARLPRSELQGLPETELLERFDLFLLQREDARGRATVKRVRRLRRQAELKCLDVPEGEVREALGDFLELEARLQHAEVSPASDQDVA